MINKNLIFFSLLFILLGQSSCNNADESAGCRTPNESISVNSSAPSSNLNVPYLVVLGIAQDGGYPQAGCQKQCCKRAWDYPPYKRLVSCLAVVDPITKQKWLFDATPDFLEQLHLLALFKPSVKNPGLSGIFLTHAHIGHYTGLMLLGHEVMGTKDVKVFAMPRMYKFLRTNGPWSQLVDLNNISLIKIKKDSIIKLNVNISIMPFVVPHRDEFSETVGYKIIGPNKSVIFIPDIDKWEKWETNIIELIKQTECAFVDGTFYDDGELPGRDMSKIAHPFIKESMRLFKSLSKEHRAKIHFIHLNHTNPVLNKESEQHKKTLEAGFNIAEELKVVKL